jgi:acetyl-CoA carboxylase, biotin carboxylase subunit
VDGGVYAGWTVPIDYDPLLAKLSVWAATRPAAIDRMRRAVSEYRVLGTITNLSLFERLMRDERWIDGDLDTGFLDRFMHRSPPAKSDDNALIACVLAAAETVSRKMQNGSKPTDQGGETSGELSRWRSTGLADLIR